MKKHPSTIIATCNALGKPLPNNATIQYQPSKYIKKGILNGDLFEIKVRLGKNFPQDISNKELKVKFKAFRRKYKSQKNLKYTLTDLSVYFTDWLLFARNRGFTHNCYFDYELYNKEPDVRDTFLNEGYRIRVHNACTTTGYRSILLNKAKLVFYFFN